MRHNSDLFELIKSLNKNEKRYFKLYVSLQKGNKNYLKLFDALETLKEYDESKLKKRYKTEKFVKHYSYNKNYLYRMIIKNMVNYNSEKDTDIRIQSSIAHCKILFSKALYKQYFRQIARAKSFALKHERFGYYLQLLDMEKIIIKKEEIQSKKSEEIYQEAIIALDQYRTMFELSRLASILLANYRAHGLRREKRHDEIFNEVLNHPAMNTDKKSLCWRAKESYYRIKEIISDTKGNVNEVRSAQETRFNIVALNPDPFRNYIINYYNDILNSLIYTNLSLNYTEDSEKYLKLYKKSTGNSDNADYEIMVSFTGLILNLKMNSIKKASSFIMPLENILKKYENKIQIDTELAIRFNIIKCRMLEKNYENALSSANTLLAHPLISKRTDYELYLRLMILVIHYELKNFSLLRYLIISTYRFLYKREKLYKLETFIIEFIRKLPEIKNESAFEFTLIQYKKRLERLKKDEYEKNAFEYFDFLKWIEEKIT